MSDTGCTFQTEQGICGERAIASYRTRTQLAGPCVHHVAVVHEDARAFRRVLFNPLEDVHHAQAQG